MGMKHSQTQYCGAALITEGVFCFGFCLAPCWVFNCGTHVDIHCLLNSPATELFT